MKVPLLIVMSINPILVLKCNGMECFGILKGLYLFQQQYGAQRIASAVLAQVFKLWLSQSCLFFLENTTIVPCELFWDPFRQSSCLNVNLLVRDPGGLTMKMNWTNINANWTTLLSGSSLDWQWTWIGQMEMLVIFTLATPTMGRPAQKCHLRWM